jgi:hypothetical protein
MTGYITKLLDSIGNMDEVLNVFTFSHAKTSIFLYF